MTNKKYKSISISNLIINPDNDRFESVENEKQAIDIMLTKLGDKIYYIAIHILENGLSPKPFYVMPSKKSNKKFLVKEGNRRTTALKLMANPKLIDSKKHASLKNRFFKLHERFMETPIRKIMCYIYDDVEEADKWVRLEHTGEQNGVGIVEWKPEQVQRFDIKHGKNKSVEIQAIDFIRTSPFVQEEVKRASENIKLTNFARLLGDKSVREILGLKYINSKLSSNLEEEEIAKALGQIILDLSDKDFKVSSIYNAKQRKDYIQGLGEKLPDKNKTIGEVWRLDNPLEQIPNLEEEDNTAKNEGSDLHSKGHLKKSIPTQRKTLIPNNCIIRISNPKANKIYDELKKIDVRSFVNCAAVTLRVFLELSVDTFIEKKGLLKEGEISASNSSRSLYQKVNDASQYLYKEKIADETILKAGNYLIDARYNSDDLKKRIKLIALYKDKIELHNLDAVELIHNLQSNLPNNSLFYFDPPYYKKGKGLYMNYYDDQDHRDIYNAIAGLENIKWVVTYDKEDFILDLYLKFRMYEYSLNYSAATVGKGQEYMIFSDNCIVPEKSSINFNKVITI